ncbi:hypothetical protein PENSPDRAFT_645518 [Peniophora sp. CONT]|nr:hypothetical protein PENSPDRAFT_645518 [Peniophora sp. CONT]
MGQCDNGPGSTSGVPSVHAEIGGTPTATSTILSSNGNAGMPELAYGILGAPSRS